MTPIASPPPALDCARVLEYVVLNDSVGFSGRTLLFVSGNELGRVPCLAICENKRLPNILLFHCDKEWTVLGSAGYATVREAKERAERTYPGLSNFWIDAKVSEEMAERYLDELFGDDRCSVCGKRADQVDQIEQRGELLVCNFCIRGEADK
jgi:hypothetical protein